MPEFPDIRSARHEEGEKTLPDGRNGGQEDAEAVLQEEYGSDPEGHGRGTENPGDPPAGTGRPPDPGEDGG